MSFGLSLGLGFSSIGRSGAGYGNDFVLVVATTSPAETVTIPCRDVGTFNAEIDWGDGATSTITAYDDSDLAHEYADVGDHIIRISGTFPSIRFNNGGDRLKLKEVVQLGKVGWQRLDEAFYGCTNLTSFACGVCDTASVVNMAQMLRDCSSLSTFDVAGLDTSSVTDLSQMVRGCSSLATMDVTGFDTSSVTAIAGMFRDCSSLSGLDISGWDVSGVTNGTNFMNGANAALDTAAYDATLIAWAAQSVQSSVAMHFGDAEYTSGGAAADARAVLVTGNSWTITDGGSA